MRQHDARCEVRAFSSAVRRYRPGITAPTGRDSAADSGADNSRDSPGFAALHTLAPPTGTNEGMARHACFRSRQNRFAITVAAALVIGVDAADAGPGSATWSSTSAPTGPSTNNNPWD